MGKICVARLIISGFGVILPDIQYNISKGDTVTFEIANTGSSYAYTFVDPTVKYEAYG